MAIMSNTAINGIGSSQPMSLLRAVGVTWPLARSKHRRRRTGTVDRCS
jgi:hypothetical protein